MIKFDENGQAFWDFILEKCTPEFIEAIQKNLTREPAPYEIVDVRVSYTGTDFHVYLRSGPSFRIHTELKSDTSNKRYLYEDSIGLEDIRVLSEVIKND